MKRLYLYVLYRKSKDIIPLLKKCKAPGVLTCYPYILKCVHIYKNDVDKCEESLYLELGDKSFFLPFFRFFRKREKIVWVIKRNKTYFFLVFDKKSLHIRYYGKTSPNTAGYVVDTIFSHVIWNNIKDRVMEKIQKNQILHEQMLK